MVRGGGESDAKMVQGGNRNLVELCRGLDSAGAGACSATAENGAGAWNFIFVLRKMKKISSNQNKHQKSTQN